MDIAQVIGQVVATVKEPGLSNHKLLVLRCADPTAPDGGSGDTYVAVDLVGVGRGELVLVATGSAARMAAGTADCPTDAAVVAVIDNVVIDGDVTFTKF
jgi:ethanolamine utilization protein EutN